MKKINLLFTGQDLDPDIKTELPEQFMITVLPFIKTEYLTDKHLIDKINLIFESNAQVVVTSNIAAKWIIQYASKIPHWNIACMTGKTQEAFTRKGWGDLIALTDKRSESLVEKIEKTFSKSEKVHFVTGDRHLDIIPIYLSKKGFDIEIIITYTTIEVEHNLKEAYDGIIFLSPSAVKSFFRQHNISENIPLFAIGNTTATALKKIVLNPIITALQPIQKILFNTIENYFRELWRQ